MDLELYLTGSFMHLKCTDVAQCSFTTSIELRDTSSGGGFMDKFCLVTNYVMFFKHASSVFDSAQYIKTFSRVN